MRGLESRIHLAINEVRILALSAQMLLATELTATFHERFLEIDPALRTLTLLALSLSLFALSVLLLPTAFHRLVLEGNDTPFLLELTSRAASFALLPTLSATTLVLFVACRLLFGLWPSLLAAGLSGGMATVLWYAPHLIERLLASPEEPRMIESRKEKKRGLESKVEHVLTEARVVLPGVQAFVGFQFATMFTRVFESVPEPSKIVHLISLGLVTLSGIILITPAAYHRIVEKGELTERFHTVASRLMLLALIPLALGFATDVYVVAATASGSEALAIGLAAFTAAATLALWFGFSYVVRAKRMKVKAARRGQNRRRYTTSPQHP